MSGRSEAARTASRKNAEKNVVSAENRGSYVPKGQEPHVSKYEGQRGKPGQRERERQRRKTSSQTS